MTEEPTPQDERLMTIKEVAEYLAIHEMTLYALIHESDIPAMKLGGQWRFKKAVLDEWLSQEMNKEQLEKEQKNQKNKSSKKEDPPIK